MKLRKLATELLYFSIFTIIMVLALAGIGYVGYAHADAGTSISPDDPVSALGTLYDFMRTGKGTAAVGVALILVVWLLRNLPIQKWKDLVQTPTGGYLLVYGTALLTYVGTGLASGNPFTAMMLLNAAGAALVASGGWEHLRDVITALLKKPAMPPAIPPAAGAVLLVLVFGALTAPLVGTLASCQVVKDAGQAVIDCTKENQAQLEAFGLDLLALVPDWKAVEAKAESSAATIGENIAGCALAKIVNEYMTSKSVKRTEDTWAAHDALEHFRSNKLGGATLHTAQGDL